MCCARRCSGPRACPPPASRGPTPRPAPGAGPDSPIRVAAKVWQVLTTPLRFIAFYASWLTERPSRFLVFITVYALLASTSYASWLPWIW